MSLSVLSVSWYVPGNTRTLLFNDGRWQAYVAGGFQVLFFTVPLIGLGFWTLTTLLSRLLGAQWWYAQRFEERMLPKVKNHRLLVSAAQVGITLFAVFQIVTG